MSYKLEVKFNILQSRVINSKKQFIKIFELVFQSVTSFYICREFWTSKLSDIVISLISDLILKTPLLSDSQNEWPTQRRF